MPRERPKEYEAIYAPVGRFLPLLAAGWRLQDVAEPMRGHHGVYSVLLWREIRPVEAQTAPEAVG